MPTYKDGKQTTPITFEEFQKVIEPVESLNHKSFLAFLFLSGVRVSEAYERVKGDFKIINGDLVIHCPAKKHGIRQTLKLAVDMPYMPLIIEQINKTRKSKDNPDARVWNISATTSWRIVKRVMPHHYPHFLRLNRAVRFLDDPSTTIPEMQAWFGWTNIETINSYIGFAERHLDSQTKRLKRQFK